MTQIQSRCPWSEINDLERHYHDTEWGVPQTDDTVLFEFLILEGAQAGLSWDTVLKKRENYRAAFAEFDPQKVARFTPAYEQKLLSNIGIIRNRAKVASAVTNAKVFLNIQAEYGSFARFIWRHVDGKPIQNTWRRVADVPVSTKISDASTASSIGSRGISRFLAVFCSG